MTAHITVNLTGEKVGRIWNGQLCTKEFSENLSQPVRGGRGTFLRELFLLCRDGDFQDCKLASDSLLTLEICRYRPGGRTQTQTRVFFLEEFPSAADFVCDPAF